MKRDDAVTCRTCGRQAGYPSAAFSWYYVQHAWSKRTMESWPVRPMTGYCKRGCFESR